MARVHVGAGKTRFSTGIGPVGLVTGGGKTRFSPRIGPAGLVAGGGKRKSGKRKPTSSTRRKEPAGVQVWQRSVRVEAIRRAEAAADAKAAAVTPEEEPPPGEPRPHPYLLLFGLFFLFLPVWHAYRGAWTSQLNITAGLLVWPSIGLLLLRFRLVKRGQVPPAQNQGSRLVYLLALMWAAGPAMMFGDDWLYGGSGARDTASFVVSSLICWAVAFLMLGSTVRSQGAEPESPRRRLNAPLTAGFLAAVILGVHVYPTGTTAPAPVTTAEVATTTAPAETSPTVAQPVPATAAPVVPDLVGMRLPEAEQALLGTFKSTHDDRSPRDRSVFVRDNWTVVETTPAAGQPVEPGRKVELFLLKNSEAAWFAEHPVMPKLKAGTDALDLTDSGQPLDGISELVELRYTKRATPADAGPPDEETGLVRAYTGLVVGSLPAPGRKLSTGQLIIVTVKEKPAVPAAGGTSSNKPKPRSNSEDGDDDFNVPGWLCPTRFC